MVKIKNVDDPEPFEVACTITNTNVSIVKKKRKMYLPSQKSLNLVNEENVER